MTTRTFQVEKRNPDGSWSLYRRGQKFRQECFAWRLIDRIHRKRPSMRLRIRVNGECDCQNPNQENGAAGVSMTCPVHNDKPYTLDEADFVN